MSFREVKSSVFQLQERFAFRGLAADNMTMVIVTHEMKFAHDVSDWVMFMDDGVVCEQGTSQQVFDNPQHERTKEFLNSYEK